jgi:excisionase family DNA binding protein
MTDATPMQPLAVRMREAARLLSVSERTLHDLIKRGQIRATKVAPGRRGAVLVRVADIDAYLCGDSAGGDPAAAD